MVISIVVTVTAVPDCPSFLALLATTSQLYFSQMGMLLLPNLTKRFLFFITSFFFTTSEE